MKNFNMTFPATVVASILILFLPLAAADDYTLTRCRELALKNNVAVRNADLEVAAARELKRSAFTRYFPSVSASGLAMSFDDPVLQLGSMSLLDKLTLGSVTVVQPLFAGGRIIAGNKLAEVGRQASEQKRKLSENETLLKTEEQYWLIVSLDEKVKTLELYTQMLDDLGKQAGDAYRAGVIARNDLLKVNVKQSELQLQRLQLADGRHLALLAFCQFLGIEFDPVMKLRDSLQPAPLPQSLFIENSQALPQRAEFSLLNIGVRAEKLQGDMKRGELLPQIGVGVGGFYLRIMQGQHQYNTTVFASVSIPISGWWGGAYELKEKKLREQIARNNLRDGGEMLQLQMQKAWYELGESYREIELAQKLVEQSEENLKVNEESYRQGISLLSDLLDAQAGLQQARSKLIDAMAGNRVKTVNYLIVTGRTDLACNM
jgi:outer membrane protein